MSCKRLTSRSGPRRRLKPYNTYTIKKGQPGYPVCPFFIFYKMDISNTNRQSVGYQPIKADTLLCCLDGQAAVKL